MKAVFADTTFFLAVVNPDDVWHDLAVKLSQARSGMVVLTEFVLVEIGNTLRKGWLRPYFIGLARHMQSDPEHQIVPASPELIERGMVLYEKRPDKEWSLTDCISFVVMTELEITDALSSDKHFEQAGFNILLK